MAGSISSRLRKKNLTMTSAANLYHSVINDVINSVRDSFLDEAVDESVLQELKQLWMSKLDASKTIEQNPRAEAAVDSKPGRGAAARGARGAAAAAAVAAAASQQGASGAAGASSAVPGMAAGSSSTGSSSVPFPAPAAGAAGAAAASSSSSSATAGNQLVITDPNRLVPVQITIPAQPGNPASQPRALTVQVPAHALQQSGATSQLLQQVLTQAITQALSLPESHAAVFLQNQINHAFKLQ